MEEPRRLFFALVCARVPCSLIASCNYLVALKAALGANSSARDRAHTRQLPQKRSWGNVAQNGPCLRL
jgi:hypothetical protein